MLNPSWVREADRWSKLLNGKAGATHVVIVCDTYDHSDYPVYCWSAEEARKHATDRTNMKRPMEVYNLQGDLEAQLDLDNPRSRNWEF